MRKSRRCPDERQATALRLAFLVQQEIDREREERMAKCQLCKKNKAAPKAVICKECFDKIHM